MQLTDPQRRTLERLIGTGERPVFPSDLSQRLRDRIEAAARGLDLRDPLWLGKERLHDHARCEGLLQSHLLGEAPPFEHSPVSAGGVLAHKVVEVDMASRDLLDPQSAADVAARRLADREERFREHWTTLASHDQEEVLMEAARRVTLLRASFPPLRELRRALAPVSELRARAELLGGDIVLSGQIDLVLGLADLTDPSRATRLTIDFKTGSARPEHVEDNRFYALLLTLRFGVPPYRVASFFLESGTWQAEDVTEQTLMHAADRVVAAARSAAGLVNGRVPSLSPGPWCGWCPRATACPLADPIPA
ncbi:MAG TPA: PD-(D/E)XK nuclease family protein [Actinomycetota bacterium]|nr:PD-(D/E)XK nuclease family protein [Actinomycetota bacterium]